MTVLLQGVVGSRAYGLAIDGSDVDRLAIHLADSRAFLGLDRGHAADATHHVAVAGGDDMTSHELGKFCRLALQSNPAVNELLWLDGFETTSPEGQWLVEHRTDLLDGDRVRHAWGRYATRQRTIGLAKTDRAARFKAGKHLYRLVQQGIRLHCTGELVLRVDREMCFRFAEAFADGRDDGMWLVALFDQRTNEHMSALGPSDPDLVNDWLVSVRAAHLDRGAATAPWSG